MQAGLLGADVRYRVTAPGSDEGSLRLGANLAYDVSRRLVLSGYYTGSLTAGTQVSRSYGDTFWMRF